MEQAWHGLGGPEPVESGQLDGLGQAEPSSAKLGEAAPSQAAAGWARRSRAGPGQAALKQGWGDSGRAKSGQTKPSSQAHLPIDRESMEY